MYRNHACSPAPQLVCIFFGEISPECHPERGSACTTESKFCGAEQREAKQNRERDERQRAAGSRMGFLNICSASVAFTKPTQPDYVRILPCANKRVINRSQIPLRATALALLLTAMRPRAHSRIAKVRLRSVAWRPHSAQDDTRGKGRTINSRKNHRL